MENQPNGTFAVNTTVQIECDEGYHVTRILGSAYATCEEPGIWTFVPECIPNEQGK